MAYGFSYSDICTHAMICTRKIYNDLATQIRDDPATVLRDDYLEFSEIKEEYDEGDVAVHCNINPKWLMRIIHYRSQISVVYIKDNIELPLGPMTSVKHVRFDMAESHALLVVDGYDDLETLTVTVPRLSAVHIMNCPNLNWVMTHTLDYGNYAPYVICDVAPKEIYGKPKVFTGELFRGRDYDEQPRGIRRRPAGN